MALLTLRNGLALTPGVGYCILEAFLYSAAILVTDRLTHAGAAPLLSGVVQVGTIAVLSLAASLLTETPRLPAGAAEWIGIGLLAVVCTGFGFTLQPVAQSGTTAERSGMFCALNPLVASVLGVAFLRETLTAQGLAGMGLILGGILLGSLRRIGKPRAGAIPARPCGEH